MRTNIKKEKTTKIIAIVLIACMVIGGIAGLAPAIMVDHEHDHSHEHSHGQSSEVEDLKIPLGYTDFDDVDGTVEAVTSGNRVN